MIGIFGGTFDPIHLGHLRLALELLEQSALTEIRFIPCQIPVHKSAAIASAEHRLALLKLATADEPRFVVDDRELKRSTPSFMIETVQSLQQDFPEQAFSLILGSDSAMNFMQWRDWTLLLSLVSLIVIPRQGARQVDLPLTIRDQVQWQTMTTLTLSSSDIRLALQQGRSIRYWVSDQVADYIDQWHLYR